MEELSAEIGPQTPVGNVQVDAFCAHCSYNLFSQVVSRDQRLGILVCRCPECGRFSAAGNMTTASQRLAQRLATGGLVVYIGFLLGVLALASGILLATQGTYLDDRFRNEFERTDHRQDVATWPELVGAAITASALGGVLATFCWHWRRGWRYIAAIVPVPLGILAWRLWTAQGYFVAQKPALMSWGIGALGLIVGLQIAGIIAGEALGRPIARIGLQLLLPARLRQYLGFLWFVDGKMPPSPPKMSAPSSL